MEGKLGDSRPGDTRMVGRHHWVGFLLAIALSGCGGLDEAFTARPAGSETQQPQDPYEAGRGYFEQRQYGLALEAFRNSLRQNPDSVRNLNGVAATYDQMLRFDLADRYYKRAV